MDESFHQRKRGDSAGLSWGEMIGEKKKVDSRQIVRGIHFCEKCGAQLRQGNKGLCSLCERNRHAITLAKFVRSEEGEAEVRELQQQWEQSVRRLSGPSI